MATFQHPELEEGEVFLNNSTHDEFDRIGWRTKRMGITAYDKTNNPLDSIYRLYPVFVQRSELAEAGINPDTFETYAKV